MGNTANGARANQGSGQRQGRGLRQAPKVTLALEAGGKPPSQPAQDVGGLRLPPRLPGFSLPVSEGPMGAS